MGIPINVGEMTAEEKRLVALRRSTELRMRIEDYIEACKNIEDGYSTRDRYLEHKKALMGLLDADEDDWLNWHWHIRNRIKDVFLLQKVVKYDTSRLDDVAEVGKRFRWAISPYYAALMAASGIEGPVGMQCVPSRKELDDKGGQDDPMAEEYTSPAAGITRRYPDRLIINVTNQCPMYCRHCQRRRNIGETDAHQPHHVLEEALRYIKRTPEIRDVLITGGDALMLSDRKIEWLLSELDKIKHVEIKRLGTRTIVTLPQRITPELCSILEKHPPIYINTQFNHPIEVTKEAGEACTRLVKAGVVLGNQAVLLKGVNDNSHVMKKLNQELLKIRVRPYYIFHAKPVKGTGHFITSVDEGINIMDKLRGYTSGLAVPTYIINAPGGYGKTPVLPQYILSRDKKQVTLRTWEKRVIPYKNEG
ncbi:MAG TPA: glutamate 2,3-aminomutase [Clostridia bacterium]|nr:glutamate 2,3-aminomutase [Clostridia bacterium]